MQDDLDFLTLMESELNQLDDLSEEMMLDSILAGIDDIDSDEAKQLKEEYELSDEELSDMISEATRRRVSYDGSRSRVKTRKTQKRTANQTSGLSSKDRKQRARKAAKTRKRNPGALKKAVKKRKRAMRKRKALNISS